ncbi:MAG: LysR family transcriptional regulator [Actinobacteria bacterium]|nr:LysR family transcriptional regulator [Actinomycetota bacterium]
MTLRQLEYVLAVADTQSFTQAAVRMHVSQPSLSQQIQVLEAEIGGALFDRPPKPVRLTNAGRAFVAEARVAVASADRAGKVARQRLDLEPETLTIATVPSLSVSTLPQCVKRWHDAFASCHITLKEYPHRAAAIEAVRSHGADLGIGPTPEDWEGAVEHLGWDQLVVVLPSDDPLLQSRSPVALEGLSDRDWVLFNENHGLGETVLEACERAGFEPHPVVRTAQIEAAARLAASGLGPALVPIKNVPPDLASSVRQLDPPIAWELSAFVAETSLRRLHRSFIEVVREADWQQRVPHGASILTLG